MPGEAEEGEIEIMPMIRRVIQYSGLDYWAALALPADIFMLMYKNSVVETLRATEQGREYLEKCKRLSITEPDFKELRKRAKGGNGHGTG